jgi:hypothetical protein
MKKGDGSQPQPATPSWPPLFLSPHGILNKKIEKKNTQKLMKKYLEKNSLD